LVRHSSHPITAGVIVCACHASYPGSINRRMTAPASQNINVRPYLKTNHRLSF
jgi:hypothetical protein